MRVRRARMPPERVAPLGWAMCRPNCKTPPQAVWGGVMATASGQQQAQGVRGGNLALGRGGGGLIVRYELARAARRVVIDELDGRAEVCRVDK